MPTEGALSWQSTSIYTYHNQISLLIIQEAKKFIQKTIFHPSKKWRNKRKCHNPASVPGMGWDRGWVMAFPLISSLFWGVEYDGPSLNPFCFTEKIFCFLYPWVIHKYAQVSEVPTKLPPSYPPASSCRSRSPTFWWPLDVWALVPIWKGMPKDIPGQFVAVPWCGGQSWRLLFALWCWVVFSTHTASVRILAPCPKDAITIKPVVFRQSSLPLPGGLAWETTLSCRVIRMDTPLRLSWAHRSRLGGVNEGPCPE